MVLTVGDADDFDFFANLDDAALDTTGHDGAATGDREDVFDRHQEGLVDGALRRRDVGVQGVGQAEDGGFADFGLVAFEGLQGGAVMIGVSSPGKSYLESSSRSSISTSSSSSASSTMSHLFMYTMMYGTPT
jgi:hypothetical protein